MRVLVTGGAGFIGSHTADRLVELGHDVVVLDALTAPVHRNGRPNYLTPGAELWVGDVRNKELLANLLRRVDAVYHFAAYQDYLTDFSRFTSTPTSRSTALLFRNRGDRTAGSPANSGRILSVRHGRGALLLSQRRAASRRTCGPRPVLSSGDWEHRLPVVQRPPRDDEDSRELLSSPPEPVRDVEVTDQEMVAINLGRRYGIPTVALRYSIVQGPRQSIFNAYSGACRIFCLHYLLGSAPILYEDGAMIRDYVNIHDVVDANELVLTDARRRGPRLQRGRWNGVHDG